MKSRAIIAGATGLIGSNLAEHLVSKGWEVYGVSRSPEGVIPGVRPVAVDHAEPQALRVSARRHRHHPRFLHRLGAAGERGGEYRCERRPGAKLVGSGGSGTFGITFSGGRLRPAGAAHGWEGRLSALQRRPTMPACPVPHAPPLVATVIMPLTVATAVRRSFTTATTTMAIFGCAQGMCPAADVCHWLTACCLATSTLSYGPTAMATCLPLWLQPGRLPWLGPGPVPRPACWLELVQTPHTEAELAALRRAARARHSARPHG